MIRERKQPYFFIRSNGKFVRVMFADIIYVESRKNYVQIVTDKKNYVILNTMKQLEQALPVEDFCRIHRSYFVSLNCITAFDSHWVFIKEKILPLRDQYRKDLHQKVQILINDVRSPKFKIDFAELSSAS